MAKQMIRMIVIAGVLTGLLAASPLSAQSDALRRSQRVSGSAVTRVFEPAVAEYREAIVELLLDDESIGVGTIVSSDGLIVTKASEFVDGVMIETADGRTHEAKLLGTDQNNDIALIRINAEGLTAVKWVDGKVDNADIGKWVITPLPGRRGKLKVGLISANRRTIERAGGVLGVRLGPEDSKVKGVRVVGVAPNSAAAAVMIMQGDAITHVNGEPTPKREMLVKTVSDHAPGETIKLTVLRGEKTLELEATLGHRHGTFAIWDRNLQLSGPISKRAFGFDAILQHDTTLGPEEMGGPMFNLDGRAVGINIARVNRSETFALPADVMRPIIDRLITESKAKKPDGVTQPVSSEKDPATTQ